MISVFTDVDMTCLYSTSVPFLSNNIMTLNTKFVFLTVLVNTVKYLEFLKVNFHDLIRPLALTWIYMLSEFW